MLIDYIMTYRNKPGAYIYSLMRRFAYKTGPIITWEIVDILVYKTKEDR